MIKRKRRAKYRFKSLIRKVFLNTFWLTELEEQKLGQNVKRNITIILKRQQVRKSILTILDKRILNKLPNDRTKEEKEKLADIFQELNCFRNLPPVSMMMMMNKNYPLK